jgi:signal transduction histidine kinase/ligand-binding sensor domain-containing protein
LFGLLFLSATRAAGQGDNWFARPWETDDGLPDNIVSGVAQTPDGYLWVSTQMALMRFDGNRFQEFSPLHFPGVAERSIRCVTAARDGKLWLGTEDGTVLWLKPDQVRVFGPQDGLPVVRVRTINEDGEGAMWITYPNNGGVARIKDGKAQMLDTRQGLPGSGSCRLAVSPRGEVWFGKGGNFGVYRNGRFKTFQRLDEGVASICGSRYGGVWIATPTRLLRFQEGGEAEQKAELPKTGLSQGVILEDHMGGVWVANSVANGLFRYNGKEFETIPVSHPAIVCLYEDSEGNVWVGTGGGGLDRVRPRTVELLNSDNGSPFKSVRSISEDTNALLWVATSDGVLQHQQPDGGWTAVTAATNWPGGRADCVTADRSGAVWIGTRFDGLYRLKDNQFTIWNKDNGFTNTYVRSLLAASNGDVWIATDRPVEVLRVRAGKLEKIPTPPTVSQFRAMAQDTAENIWLGSSDGDLLKITGDHVEAVKANDLDRLMSIRSMHATADGSVWIGYSQFGIARIKDGQYTRLTTEEGLSDNYISQIISDAGDGLWLTGTHGLFRVSLREMNAVAERRASRVRSVAYGRGEGVPNLQAYYDSSPDALMARDGRVIVGMRTGVAIVHTESIYDNPKAPPVYLERVAVDGKTVALYDSRSPLYSSPPDNLLNLRNQTGGLRLRPGVRKLEFDYTALSYTAPQNMEFRYRLEGFEEEWNKGGADRVASYSSLPPGDYKFHVIACNNSGVWNEAGAVLGVKVMPFFWQQWWFWGLALGVFTLCVIAVVRYASFRRLQQQLRLMEQQAAVERERIRIARDIHDDLGDRLTTVAMLSGLALRNPANAADMPKHLEQISSTARQATDALDEIVWAINPRNDVLPNVIDYIGQFAVEFLHTADIHCQLDLPEHPPTWPVSAEVRHNLFLAVKEALNNVVRHSGASEVSLRVTATAERGSVVIEDNGRGFEGAANGPGADGLRNMNQRMAEIGGEFRAQSRPGKGTSITLEFPWTNRR